MRVAWVTSLAVAFGWLLVIWAWPASVLTLTVDDTFYALKTAINASHGEGLTFDGIHPTNGFHPLWMACLVPLARVFGSNLDAFVRVVLSVQVVLVLVGARALLRPFVAPRAACSWCAVALLFTAFYFAKIFLNGLESALEFACIGGTTALFARIDSETTLTRRRRRSFTLALACAATTLARLSAVAFAVPVLALHLGGARQRRARGLAVAVAYLGPLAAYGAYNLHAFGHVLPVSAVIKGGAAGVSAASLVTGMLVASGVAGAMVIVYRSSSQRPLARLAVPILVYALAECLYDAAIRGVLVPDIWYLVPYATVAILVVARVSAMVSTARARALGAAALVLFSVAVVAMWRARLRPSSYSSYAVARATGEWLATNTDPQSVLAGWDCGIAAAYSQRRFVNLDGLINSWAFKEQVLDFKRVQDFIEREEPIDYLVQPVPASFLRAGASRVYKGVDLASWHVVRVQPFAFESIVRREPEDLVELVLSRNGDGPPLIEYGSSASGAP